VFGAALEREGAAVVVRLQGRLSYAATPALDAALADAVGRSGTDALLDLSAVDYISGRAAVRLAALADLLAARGGRLRLRGLQEPVRRVLDYAGVLDRPAVVIADAGLAATAGEPTA
jgi:anti-anti-sigma factor